jgi:predicted amidophosphoribosyltransferase
MAEDEREARKKVIFEELYDLHRQDSQLSQHRDLTSNAPVVPVPLSAFTEWSKRFDRRGELHKELRQLALEK